MPLFENINKFNVITEKYFTRGQDFELDVDLDEYTSKPDLEDGTTFTFLGWDTNGDNIPDILPKRMYYSFNAKPVYFEFNPAFSKTSICSEDSLLERAAAVFLNSVGKTNSISKGVPTTSSTDTFNGR